jgi:hypothetical protein
LVGGFRKPSKRVPQGHFHGFGWFQTS